MNSKAIVRLASIGGLAAALAAGTIGATAGPYGPESPVISATASGTQPNCSYAVTASIANITPGDTAAIGVILWVDGKLTIYSGSSGAPLPTVVYPPSVAALNPSAIWQQVQATPATGTYELAIYVGTVGGSQWSPNGEVVVHLPGGYVGTCLAPAPTAAPTVAATSAPAAAPTAAPATVASAPALTKAQPAASSPATTTTVTRSQSPQPQVAQAPVKAAAAPTSYAGVAVAGSRAVPPATPVDDPTRILGLGIFLLTLLLIGWRLKARRL